MFWSDMRNMQQIVVVTYNFAGICHRREEETNLIISYPGCPGPVIQHVLGPVLWQWDINSSRAGQNICCSRQIPTVSYTYRPAAGYSTGCIITPSIVLWPALYTIQWSSVWTFDNLWRRILSLDLCAKVTQFYNGGGNLFNYPLLSRRWCW